ncbi:MAG: nuclease [Desulfobacula sp.]|nr:nuclease [Desulfobacula sp.]
MLKAFIYLFLLFSCSILFLGNIYFWTDENGIRHFSNIAPAQNQKVEEFEESNIVFKDQKFQVLKVYDGDTIKVTGFDLTFKIRLVGIDCPETGYKKRPDQPFGQKAKSYLKNLLNNKTIAMKSYGTGGYNRQLAEVFVNGKNVNLEMIKAGFAEVYRGRRPKSLDSARYLREESRAKIAKKGMWRQGKSYVSPKQWRKDHPIK